MAMESTSFHWIPVYEILESRGFETYLLNAPREERSGPEDGCI